MADKMSRDVEIPSLDQKNLFRFSLRTLFFVMTAVAILATVLVNVLKLPSNLQEVLFILAIISGGLFVGALGSSLMIHPIGSLLVSFVAGSYFAVVAFQCLQEVLYVGQSLLSWKGLWALAYLAAATAATAASTASCYYHSWIVFRAYRERSGEAGEE